MRFPQFVPQQKTVASQLGTLLGVLVLLAAEDPARSVEPPITQDAELILDQPVPLQPISVQARSPSVSAPAESLPPEVVRVDNAEGAVDRGAFHLLLHGSVTASYDSNLFITHDNEQEDFRFKIAPGIALGLGDFKKELPGYGRFDDRYDPFHWRRPEGNFIYIHAIPAYTFLADHTGEDSFDPDVTLDSQYKWKRLTLDVTARYQRVNYPDADLGQLIEVSIFGGVVTAKYDFSAKTSFELDFYNDIRDYDGVAVDSVEYRGAAWLAYQVLPKINLAVGFSYGAIDPSAGPTETYEQILARARYSFTEKLGFELTGGVEFRDIPGFASPTNGIFSLGVSYRPFNGTLITLRGYRRNTTSATFPPSEYTSTGGDLTIRQRLFGRVYASVAGGYQNSDYNTFTQTTSRQDDIYLVRPSVGIDLLKHVSAEVGAEFRKDDSSQANRTFSQTTVYLQLNTFF